MPGRMGQTVVVPGDLSAEPAALCQLAFELELLLLPIRHHTVE
jgi:hypothetical protein